MDQKSLNLVNYLLEYAGKKKRVGDLFGSKANLLDKALNKISERLIKISERVRALGE